MTEGPAIIASRLQSAYGTSARGVGASTNEATVPWTFNQILLPIILVLTFVIFTYLTFYQAKYEEERDRRQKVEREFNKFRKHFREREGESTGMITLINLQLYKLKRALEVAKYQARDAYGALGFVTPQNAGDVERDGLELADEKFKTFCAVTRTLKDSRSAAHEESYYQQQALAMYAQVLKRAAIGDEEWHRQDEVFVRRTQSLEPSKHDFTLEEAGQMDDDEYTKDVYYHVPKQIVSRNRRIIHNLILDCLDSLIEQADQVQDRLITILRGEAIADLHPDKLSQEDRRLLNALFDESLSPTQRQAYTRQLYFSLTVDWEERYSAAGYPMVIWDRLKSL